MFRAAAFSAAPFGAETFVNAGSGGFRYASAPANFRDVSGVKKA